MGFVKSPCLKALTDSTLLTTPLFKKEVIKNFGHSHAFRSSQDEHGNLKFFEFCPRSEIRFARICIRINDGVNFK